MSALHPANHLAHQASQPANQAVNHSVSCDASLAHDYNSFKKEASKKRRDKISGALFYIVLIAILAVLYTQTADVQSGAPRHMAGYSAMRVLTGSMQSAIPQDSLIVTQQVPAADIRVGDDITFLVNESTTITHRVITIYENYAGTGQRGFQTQGIENPLPDRDIVLEENIVGRVVFHNLAAGQTMRFISENVLLVGVMTILVMGFFAAAKLIFKPGTEEEELNPHSITVPEGKPCPSCAAQPLQQMPQPLQQPLQALQQPLQIPQPLHRA